MNAFLWNFVILLGWNLKKTISRKNVRVLLEKICIFHSNSKCICVYVSRQWWRCCEGPAFGFKSPLQSSIPQFVWLEMISKNYWYLCLNLCPLQSLPLRTTGTFVRQSTTSSVNNLFSSLTIFDSFLPPASPLTDPPSLYVNAGCRWLESWVNYICAPSECVLRCRCFYR